MRKAGFSKGCKFYIAQSIVSERIVMSTFVLSADLLTVQVNY